MHREIHIVIRYCFSCWLLFAASTALAATEPLTLSQALAEAEANNPRLAAVTAQAEGLAQVSSQAGALPDPRLSLNMVNLPTDSWDRAQEPMSQFQLGLSQDLPFPGKRRLRSLAAESLAAAAGHEVKENRLRLIREVRHQWWELFYLDRALETIQRNQALLRQSVSTAQAKYRVGQGLQQDVLLAQLELSKLHDKEIQFKARRRHVESRMNRLLGRTAGSVISLPQSVGRNLPEIPPETTLQNMALENRPALKRQQKRLDAAEQQLGLAQKDRLPDFRVGLLYGQREARSDLASVQFSMNLPLYAGSKQNRRVDQRNSELQQQRYALEDLQNRVGSEISQGVAQYQQSRQQTELFEKGIIPQARQTVDSMSSGYQVNKVDFLNLVRAQVILYDYETQYWQSLAAARQALALLEAAVGKALSKALAKELTDE